MAARHLPQSLPSALRVMRKCRDQFQITPVPAEQAIGVAIWNELNPGNAAGLLRRLETEMSVTPESCKNQELQVFQEES